MDLNNDQKVVLLTGGAGFIGSFVAELLLNRGDRVVIVDELNDYYDVDLKLSNLKRLSRFEKYKFYKGDICDVTFITNVFEQERPTHVCHLAARAGVRPSIVDPYIYVHSNVEGTTRLLDLARVHLIKNFVYASSSSVYGCSTNSVLSEHDAVEKPVSPYAATKKACELLAYTFHHLYGLNCTGLRFFTVYGPNGRPDMAPFKFIDRIFKGLPIQQYGDGSTSRDYTYIDDIAAAVVTAIDTPVGCEVINLGNGRPYLLKDFITLVEKCVGKEAVIEIMPEQPGDVDRTCANIEKACRLLNYQPKVSFEEGISRTVDWYKQAHRDGFFTPKVVEIISESNDKKDIVSIPPVVTGKDSDVFAFPPRPRKIKRDQSELELSSFVQKATKQCKRRSQVYISAEPVESTSSSPKISTND